MSDMRSVRWVFDCFSWKPTVNELSILIPGVQSEEKERIGRFVFMKDAKSSLVGRLLIRKFVCDNSGLDWDKIKLTRDENGKPIFDNPEIPLSFNISHQGRYVVLAGEVGSIPLGVDLMEMDYKGGKPVSEFFRLMNRNFDPQEWRTITEPKTEKERVQMFYRYWCLKESYVKATGLGLRLNLSSLVFKINTTSRSEIIDDTQVFVSGVEQKHWCFHESLLDEDYCCAVAISCKNGQQIPKTPFSKVSINEILAQCKSIGPDDPGFCTEFLKKE